MAGLAKPSINGLREETTIRLLSFHKTLKENLPEFVDPSINEIHFTEDGGIYLNNNAGKLVEMGSRVTNEYHNHNYDNTKIYGGGGTYKDYKLVGIYDFDEKPTNRCVVDKSRAKNNSVAFVKEPKWELDNELGRGCYRFVASNTTYISAGTYFKTPIASVFALAYRDDWSKTLNAFQSIVSCTQGGGYSLNIGTDANITAMIYVNGAYSKITIATPSELNAGWHSFGFTYDGYVLRGYIDGKCSGELVISSSEKANIAYHASNHVMIGAEGYSGATPESGYYFDGKIAEVRFYNDGLEKDEAVEVCAEIIDHKLPTYKSSVNINGDCTIIGETHEHENLEVLGGLSIVDGKLMFNGQAIGGEVDLSGLNTTDTTLVGAINEVLGIANQAFQSASDGKKKVAQAIAGKGINIGVDATFDEIAQSISSIKQENYVGEFKLGEELQATYESDFEKGEVGFLKVNTNKDGIFGLPYIPAVRPPEITCSVIWSNDSRNVHCICTNSSSAGLVSYRIDGDQIRHLKTQANGISTSSYITIDVTGVISPDNKTMIISGNSGNVGIYNLEDNGTPGSSYKVLCSHTTGATRTYSICATSDFRYVFTAWYSSSSTSRNIISKLQLDSETGKYVSSPVITGSINVKATVTPDDKYLVMFHGSGSRTFRIDDDSFDVNMSISDVVFPAGTAIDDIVWSNSGEYMVLTLTASPYIAVYRYNDGQFTKMPGARIRQNVYGATFSKDDTHLFIGGRGSNLYVYENNFDGTFTEKPAHNFPEITSFGAYLYDAKISPNGKFIALAIDVAPFVAVYEVNSELAEFVVTKNKETNSGQIVYIGTTNEAYTENTVWRMN